MQTRQSLLVVICGPTASGKTDLAIQLAKHFDTEILSADSRQFYSGLRIGTAAPDAEQLSSVRHHFVAHLPPDGYYNVSRFEQDALAVLSALFRSHRIAILAGGSGLYIDAVCQGIDDFPDPSPELRKQLKDLLAKQGISHLLDMLHQLDPSYAVAVDQANPNRILRALEVSITCGRPYSEMRTASAKPRPFDVLKFGLEWPRETLIQRIHQRVDQMMADGFLTEVESLKEYRDCNALNTVGYKELFAYLNGETLLDEAIEKIKTNTRRYAKRQMTWFRRDADVHWMPPGAYPRMVLMIEDWLNKKAG